MILARIRDVLFHAITTPAGDSLAAIRVPKDIARRVNMTLGMPLASAEDIAKRDAARQRLAALRAGAASEAESETAAAPVLVYFEKDSNTRELGRIEELLGARGLTWKRLDVAGDEATMEFVLLKAKCERDDLPVVFVADRAIGSFPALVDADVSGELARAIHGDR